MSQRFVIADPHFDHDTSKWDKPRPFATVQEMNKTIIDNINKTCGKNDILYVLGDLGMKAEAIAHLGNINCRIRLVLGNHDFYDPIAWQSLGIDLVHGLLEGKINGKRGIMTHVPIHPQCLTRWDFNIHGHLHSHKIDDPRYHCVSVEQINYTPVLLENIIK